MKKCLFLICFMSILMLSACSKNEHINNESVDVSENNIEPTITTIDSGETEFPVEIGDYIYKNEEQTEIIGLSENGKATMDLYFPENVVKISNIYIPSDSLLKYVEFLNPNVVLENVSFKNAARLEEVKNFPTTLTEIPEDMFSGCTSLRTFGDTENVITIPDNITSIASGAFSGCESIHKVDFNNVINVGSYSFIGCTKLSDIDWKSVETIGDAAFFSAGMTKVNLGDNVKTLGAIVFFRCDNLTSLNINNVEIIGQQMCEDCTSLTDFYANKNFKAVVFETVKTSEDEIDDAYDRLFDDDISVNLHINPTSNYAEYLKTHNKPNLTIIE